MDDLIDDLWLDVFNFIPFGQRIHVVEVSKRWQRIARNPLAWRNVELKIENYTDEFAADLTHFLATRCGLVRDLYLNFEYSSAAQEDPSVVLLIDTIFSIKSLQRLVLHGIPLAHIPGQVPACRDLKLFHYKEPDNESLQPSTLSAILSGLPNLEELYVFVDDHHFFNLFFKLPPPALRKLQRLNGYSMTDVEAVEIFPSLKYLIIEDSIKMLPAITQLKNTTVISSRVAFDDTALNTFKKLAPILVPYTSSGGSLISAILTLPVRDYGRVDFLVKELGYNINCSWSNVNAYRPSFFSEVSYTDSDYPLHVAVILNEPKLVRDLIALGATAECPDPQISYIKDARNEEVMSLLLQNGADPNKVIQLDNVDCPAYHAWLTRKMDISPVVFDLLKTRINVHDKWQNGSLLSWALGCKAEMSFRLLVEAGAKIEVSLLLDLKDTFPDLLNLVIEQKCYFDDGILKNGKNLLHKLSYSSSFIPFPTNESTAVVKQKVQWKLQHNASKPLLESLINNTTKVFDLETSFKESLTLTPPKVDLSASFGFASPSSNIIDSKSVFMDLNPFAVSTTTSPMANFNPMQFITPQASPTNFTSPAALSPSSSTISPSSSPLVEFNPFKMTHEQPNASPQERKIKKLCTQAKFKKDESISIEDSQYEHRTGSVVKGVSPIPKLIEDNGPKLSMSGSVGLDLPSPFRQTSFEKIFDHTIELMKDKINDLTPQGDTALLLACRTKMLSHDKLYRVKALVANGADVNIANEFGWSPIHAACYCNDWPVIDFLVDSGVKLDVQDNYGNTPLAALIYSMHSNEQHGSNLQKILAQCSSATFRLPEKYSHRTLVHMLATISSPKDFESIINKCDINAKDAIGYTPLHYAIFFGNLELANYLIDNGADVNAQSFAMKLTPLMLFLHLLVFATDGEADLNPYFISQMSMFCSKPKHIKDANTEFEAIDPWWIFEGIFYTKRHITIEVKFNSTAILKKLIELSNVYLEDGEGNTFLHLYVKYNCLEAVDLFKKYPMLCQQKNYDGDSPFILACRYEMIGPFMYVPLRIGIELTLLSSGLKSVAESTQINVNEQDSQGRTAIDYIMGSSLPANIKQEWSKLTTNYKVIENDLKRTPLMLHLIKMFRKVHKAKENYTLKLITQTFPQKILQEFKSMLAEQTAETINVQDSNGDTALHFACRYFLYSFIEANRGRIEIHFEEIYFVPLFELLQHNANPVITNKRGETPIDYVSNFEECRQYYQQNFSQKDAE